MKADLIQILKSIKPDERLLLVSINPEYAQMILAGKKTIELRKTMPKQKTKLMLIYETTPTKKIVGMAYIRRTKLEKIERLAKLQRKTRVAPEFLKKYYKSKKEGVAFEIGFAFELTQKISLSELKSGKIAVPQNFRYVDKEEILDLLS